MEFVEKPEDLFMQLEEIDIRRGEYLFWDATGTQVCVHLNEKQRGHTIERCTPSKRLSEAFEEYCEALEISIDLPPEPVEAWARIQEAIKKLPKKRGLLSRLFGRSS